MLQIKTFTQEDKSINCLLWLKVKLKSILKKSLERKCAVESYLKRYKKIQDKKFLITFMVLQVFLQASRIDLKRLQNNRRFAIL